MKTHGGSGTHIWLDFPTTLGIILSPIRIQGEWYLTWGSPKGIIHGMTHPRSKYRGRVTPMEEEEAIWS